MDDHSVPGMRNDGNWSPNADGQYSGDGSLWWCEEGSTGASSVTILLII